jgi:hypothetical protein
VPLQDRSHALRVVRTGEPQVRRQIVMHKFTTSTAFLLLFFVVVPPALAERIQYEQAIISEALSHYVASKCGSDWVNLATIVLDSSVQPYYGHKRTMPGSALGVIPTDLVEKLYYAPADVRVQLPERLYFPFRYVGPGEIEKFKTFNDRTGRTHFDWDEFDRRNVRGGVIQFSTPVFGNDFESAVIYVSHVCGSLCATGSILYLERTGHVWRVVRELPLWVS